MTSSPDQNPKSPYLCFVDQGSMGVAAFFFVNGLATMGLACSDCYPRSLIDVLISLCVCLFLSCHRYQASTYDLMFSTTTCIKVTGLDEA
jgi:hypothetical protein